MSALTVTTMILVMGIVWGGFLVCLAVALRKERLKRRTDRLRGGKERD